MILTVEVGTDGEVVDILGDVGGLKLLVQRLEEVIRTGDHTHLLTPSWAGTELTEVKQLDDSTLVHHLRITVVSEERRLE